MKGSSSNQNTTATGTGGAELSKTTNNQRPDREVRSQLIFADANHLTVMNSRRYTDDTIQLDSTVRHSSHHITPVALALFRLGDTPGQVEKSLETSELPRRIYPVRLG